MQFAICIFRKCFAHWFFCESEISQEFSSHFGDSSCQSGRTWHFLEFRVQMELSLHSCDLFVDKFGQSRPTPRKQRPCFSDHGNRFTSKHIRFCARESFQPWIHAAPGCSTFQLFDHVVVGMMMYVVDMMMVRLLAMTMVRISEIF